MSETDPSMFPVCQAYVADPRFDHGYCIRCGFFRGFHAPSPDEGVEG